MYHHDFYYNSKDKNVHHSLGKAACPNRMIRYSRSKQRWESWKPDEPTGYGCSAEARGPNYCCEKKHLPESRYRIRTLKSSKSINKQLEISMTVSKEGDEEQKLSQA
jgi:hypothetical protein